MKELVGVVREKGMEKFSFTGTGVGCRFWVGEVVRRRKELGLVEVDEDLKQMMGHVWDHDGAEAGEAVEVERGTWE